MIETCLDTLIEDLIFPDYHAAARLILVDHIQPFLFVDTLAMAQIAYLGGESVEIQMSTTPILRMLKNHPHTIEYIDLEKFYKYAPNIVRDKIYNGAVMLISPYQKHLENMKNFRTHIEENYPQLYQKLDDGTIVK